MDQVLQKAESTKWIENHGLGGTYAGSGWGVCAGALGTQNAAPVLF